jgi:alpha-L-rhamnosidase
VKGLEQFEATHESPYGTIVSSWKRKGRAVDYQVSVPPSSTATLYLRGTTIEAGGKRLSKNKKLQILKQDQEQAILKLEAGDYRFSVR